MAVSRRVRTLSAALAVTAAVGISGCGFAPTQKPPPDRATGQEATATPAFRMPVEKPNLLMVTVDDLSAIDMDYLPKVKQLVGEGGVTFTDALAPTPICVPARASLLSGQYAHNHGAHTIHGPEGGYPSFDDSATLATSLQDAGYTTLFTGKYLNEYGQKGSKHDVPPGWDQWRATLDPSTYNYLGAKFNVNGRVVKPKGYSTTVITQQAKASLRDARREPGAASKPWFQWVNYVAPHLGGPTAKGDPKQRFRGTKGAIGVPVPDKQDRGAYADKPIPPQPNLFSEQREGFPKGSPSRKNPSQIEKDAYRLSYQRRIESARSLDRNIASLLGGLKKTGELARTLVVFSSDNGFSSGYHNFNGKLWYYEETLRIPVLMSGPGVPKGREVGTPLTNPDIATTLLAAAGADDPHEADGVDILPWLRAPEQTRVVPIEAWPTRDGTTRLWSGVRVGRWTYVELRNGGVELYDRAADPYEMNNLAEDPGHASTLSRLADLAEKYRDCEGDACPKKMYPAGGPLDLAGL
ncbi:arylsulfatase A-like enzyme [Nocardioides luteus]|uniref:Sulfatase n=1 Tax=Nocardioides luteus TaxID=1844 RepID=A0ABQ5SUG9_9ACTN|nr:sulfatase-like hydrolase/transferase [Nocardioides luteus]MDR7309053.1 arylsulfatase A-like enzyme [Nocardioides luteus]GGR50081.1 sulfatase [Nocardioides luteus]GLJ67459.1 sulfatase [Nocardioides luteus]